MTAQYIVDVNGNHFFHSQGSSKFKVGSDGNITIPTGGNLGINGAAPQSPLDVIANGSGYAVDIRGRSSDDTSEIHFCGNDSSPNYAVIGITTTGGGQVNVQVAGSQRVAITSAGHFLPNVSGAQNLGSTTKEWGDLYFANSKGLKLGSNQAGDLYNDGTDTYFRNSASNGQMLLRSNGNILILSLIHI